jgi:two-component sensor histidine kinase
MIFNRIARSWKAEIVAVPQVSVARPADCANCAERHIAAQTFRELIEHRTAEVQLRAEHVRDVERLHELEIENHRLLNDLQLVVSLLSLQSRTQTNAETATHLSVAANRVAAIARVHRHLHSLEGKQTIAFKHYLDELCEEYSTMLIAGEGLAVPIVVEGPEIDLAAAIGTSLGLIVNELITNAIKHGRGQVTVLLAPDPSKGWALSVCNDGSTLPDGFDASARKGLGMSLIASLVAQIGGELRIERGDRDQGARFTVLFAG